jgi:translation initiation factor IF-2
MLVASGDTSRAGSHRRVSPGHPRGNRCHHTSHRMRFAAPLSQARARTTGTVGAGRRTVPGDVAAPDPDGHRPGAGRGVPRGRMGARWDGGAGGDRARPPAALARGRRARDACDVPAASRRRAPRTHRERRARAPRRGHARPAWTSAPAHPGRAFRPRDGPDAVAGAGGRNERRPGGAPRPAHARARMARRPARHGAPDGSPPAQLPLPLAGAAGGAAPADRAAEGAAQGDAAADPARHPGHDPAARGGPRLPAGPFRRHPRPSAHAAGGRGAVRPRGLLRVGRRRPRLRHLPGRRLSGVRRTPPDRPRHEHRPAR